MTARGRGQEGTVVGVGSVHYATSAFPPSVLAGGRRAASTAGVPLRPSRNVKHRARERRLLQIPGGHVTTTPPRPLTHSLTPLSHHSSASQSPHIGSSSSSVRLSLPAPRISCDGMGMGASQRATTGREGRSQGGREGGREREREAGRQRIPASPTSRIQI